MNSHGRIYQTIPLYVRGKETEFPLKLKILQHKLVLTYSSNDTVSIMTSAWSSSFYGKVLLCAVFQGHPTTIFGKYLFGRRFGI